jgi:hypothetical protein
MLELDADGKGFKPYVTNRFLRTEGSGGKPPLPSESH